MPTRYPRLPTDPPLRWYRCVAYGQPFTYRVRVYWAWVCGVNPPGRWSLNMPLDSPAALLARLKYHAQAKLRDADRRTTDSPDRFARNIGQGEAMAWREVAAVLSGSTANTDTLPIVALWSVSGYHDHCYEVGLYFTVEAAKREAQAHYWATDGNPETLIWTQRVEGDDSTWQARIDTDDDEQPDRGDYAIYPKEVWA